MRITLRRDASCKQCGAELKAGTVANWYRNGDVYGIDCHARNGEMVRKSDGATVGTLTVKGMAMKAFPGYRGRTISGSVGLGGMSLTSYWDGGYRDYHQIIRLADGARMSVPENGSGYTRVDDEMGPGGLGKAFSMPAPGFVVVTLTEGGTSRRGRVRVSVHPEDYGKFAAYDAPEFSSYVRERWEESKRQVANAGHAPDVDAVYEEQCRQITGC